MPTASTSAVGSTEVDGDPRGRPARLSDRIRVGCAERAPSERLLDPEPDRTGAVSRVDRIDGDLRLPAAERCAVDVAVHGSTRAHHLEAAVQARGIVPLDVADAQPLGQEEDRDKWGRDPWAQG